MIAALILALAVGLPTVPGALNPDVTQANIASTICEKHKPGVLSWVHNQRPSVDYTEKIKRADMKAAGLTNPKLFELDHDVSIEIGGSPTDPQNLWLEKWAGPYGAHDKDRVENALHRDVCHGVLALEAAQSAIRTNWEAEYQRRWGMPADAR